MNTIGHLTLAALTSAMLLGPAVPAATAGERSWSVTHDNSTAQGTTTVTRSGTFPWSPAEYMLTGHLNSPSTCSAVWLSQGILPGLGADPVRIAQSCGNDPVAFTHAGVSDRGSGVRAAVWLRVCAGVENHNDCGDPVVVD